VLFWSTGKKCDVVAYMGGGVDRKLWRRFYCELVLKQRMIGRGSTMTRWQIVGSVGAVARTGGRPIPGGQHSRKIGREIWECAVTSK
jgi:hypothetical protein